MKRILALVLIAVFFSAFCVQAETLSVFIPSNAIGEYSGVGVAFGETDPVNQEVCEEESCEYEVPNGTTVSLWKAIEHPRFEFEYWLVNGQRDYSQPLTFQMLENTTVLLKEREVVSGLPVIIVPGILGSWSTKMFNDSVESINDIEKKLQHLQKRHFVKSAHIPTNWTIDPIKGKYDTLRLALQDEYGSQNVFDFAYNWMQPIEDTAMQLQEKITEVLSITGANRVNIVAHSMGGLVVRYYIQNLMVTRDVEKFAMIATPNRGSVD